MRPADSKVPHSSIQSLPRTMTHAGDKGIKVVENGRRKTLLENVTEFFAGYFWFIFKNVFGWLLIIAAFPVGILLPGPGGIPIFLVGFALVTFPGKRRLTSRVMAGKGLPIHTALFTFLTAFVSIGLTCALMFLASRYYQQFLAYFSIEIEPGRETYTALGIALFGIGLIALLITWLITRLALRIVNWFLRAAPRIRRTIRPWLRKHGIHLLPARRKRSIEGTTENPEILEFHERHYTRAQRAWLFLKPWLRRVLFVGVTVLIIYQMCKPLWLNWPEVQERARDLSVARFILASLMFAAFLYFFRALQWRRVLKAFGHKLPIGPSIRIWATSELARYLPGSIWQVVGRVYLIKPYGVSGSITSTTQILELCIFLLANLILAIGCLLWYGAKIAPEARAWFIVAIALTPALALALHPKVFYWVVNRVLRSLKKPPIVQRLRGKSLIRMLAVVMIGLVWQSLAVFVILDPVLGLKLDWMWVVVGAYCLAWCAGFLAFWAPGGLGVRELVFVATLAVVLPESAPIRDELQGEPLQALLVLLGFLLRLWSIVGEVILTVVAYIVDWRGAINDPDAPGRAAVRRGEMGNPF
jgi:uncharacterized membrane protein YbhN (UPF0104 family)